MEVMIRRGGAAEAGLAADLWLRARKSAGVCLPAPVHSDGEVRSWFAAHVAGSLELWLAESAEGELLGILVLDDDWVDQLYVEPSWTGCGIGARLLATAKRERSQGLRLWTFVSNGGAQRFYEHNGFVEVERTNGSNNEEGAPDIQYAWSPR
jgi:GNAT superfamily N-acetyltransferase